MPNTHKRMAYFPTTNAEMKYSFLLTGRNVAIYLFKPFINSSKCRKTPREFAKTFKNYASYIHTFRLTDNFQNSRKKGKKRKKLTLNEYLINYSTVF